MISLFTRFVIIVAIVISVTDTVVFYHLSQNPTELTPLFVLAVIIVTIIPIVINHWYWLVFRRKNR